MPEFIHTGDEKKKYVREMFDEISPRYDFLNHFLSFGVDLYWRRKLVRALPKKPTLPVLDVATGTGDVGIAIRKRYPMTQVIGLDYAFRMSVRARKKIESKNIEDFGVIQGDGETLPFSSHRFSALTIAFGLRNIGHYSLALEEFNRVLIPGGKLVILEFAEPASELFGKFYRYYFHKVLPWLGALISGSDAYRYLPESVTHYPDRGEMSALLSNSGFTDVVCQNLSLGIATLTSALKPAN